MLRAEGEAKAIKTVFGAIHEGNPDHKLLAYQYLQTLPKLAEGASNKLWIIPSELARRCRGSARHSSTVRRPKPNSSAPNSSEPTNPGPKRTPGSAHPGFFSPARLSRRRADPCPPRFRGFRAGEHAARLRARRRLGVDYLETDVHASADAEAMLSHDPDLLRLTGRDTQLRQLTAAQLRGIDLGQGQGYASLGDVLHAFPRARFNIDVKSADAIAGTVRAVREANAEDRVLVTSFSDARRLAVIGQLPGVATSASARTFALAIAAASAGAAPVVRRVLRISTPCKSPRRKTVYAS